MKVSRAIRRIYEDQKSKNVRLKELIDSRVVGLKDSGWHYESRVKELDSFTLKIETGRYENPEDLEDFFACTIVVSNASELKRAEKLICDQFKLKERRPKKKAHLQDSRGVPVRRLTTICNGSRWSHYAAD